MAGFVHFFGHLGGARNIDAMLSSNPQPGGHPQQIHETRPLSIARFDYETGKPSFPKPLSFAAVIIFVMRFFIIFR